MGLKITAAANDTPVLWLYGIIGEDFGGVTANEMRMALNTLPDGQDIELRIHSEGGSYTESIAIHSNLVRRAGQTAVIVDGLAASGGSVVAMAGNTIEVAGGGYLMIHEAHGAMQGARAHEFREAADLLDSTNSELVKIYSKRWKGSESELRAALGAETWYSAQQAVDVGLADSVLDSMAIAAYVDAKKLGYVQVPEPLLDETKPKPGMSQQIVKAEEIVNELFAEKEELCDAK